MTSVKGKIQFVDETRRTFGSGEICLPVFKIAGDAGER